MTGLRSVLGAGETFAATAWLAFLNIVYVGGDDTGRLVTLWRDNGVAQTVINSFMPEQILSHQTVTLPARVATGAAMFLRQGIVDRLRCFGAGRVRASPVGRWRSALTAGIAVSFISVSPPIQFEVGEGEEAVSPDCCHCYGALDGVFRTRRAGGEAADRESAVITFLVTASGVTFFGVGGAFWGLLVALLTQGRGPRWRCRGPSLPGLERISLGSSTTK